MSSPVGASSSSLSRSALALSSESLATVLSQLAGWPCGTWVLPPRATPGTGWGVFLPPLVFPPRLLRPWLSRETLAGLWCQVRKPFWMEMHIFLSGTLCSGQRQQREPRRAQPAEHSGMKTPRVSCRCLGWWRPSGPGHTGAWPSELGACVSPPGQGGAVSTGWAACSGGAGRACLQSCC